MPAGGTDDCDNDGDSMATDGEWVFDDGTNNFAATSDIGGFLISLLSKNSNTRKKHGLIGES